MGLSRPSSGIIPVRFRIFWQNLASLRNASTFISASGPSCYLTFPVLKATAIGWNGRFGDKHEVGVELWQYSADQKDALGNDKIGNAIDGWYGYNYSKNLTFTAALSQLSPDDVLKNVSGGFDDKVVRLYGNARLRF